MRFELGRSYQIAYMNEAGAPSLRKIHVRAYPDPNYGPGYLRAYCHLRQEERTFRLDRISEARELEGGCALDAGHSHSRAVAITVVQHAPTPAAAAVAQSASRANPGLIFVFLLIGGAAYCLYAGFAQGNNRESGAGSAGGAGAASGSAAPALAPAPVAPPLPAEEDFPVGGKTLRVIRSAGKERYEVPEIGLRTADKLEAIASIRLAPFVERTGLTDLDLIERFLKADTNRSGRLSWDELRTFQTTTYRDFAYRENRLALRPDEFLAEGGGDCEDFALYTAALLRFWGWIPYLASLAPKAYGTGHALCLSFEEGSIPAGFTYYELASWRDAEGEEVPDGRYVPIDYDHVGELSEAVGKGWKIRELYIPESAWGQEM